MISIFLAACSDCMPDIREADESKYHQAYDYIISDTMNLKQSISLLTPLFL